MKLSYSPTSPYVRKVMVVAIETGQEAKLEKVTTTVLPTNFNADLGKTNPLAKVPALVTDSGEALFDSPVICEYLDSLHGGAKLFPSGAARWTALRRQALGDGILDAGILVRYETAVRPETLRWKDWVDGQLKKVAVALDSLEAEADKLSGVDIGTITVGCAVGYLDFRYADLGWRNGRPKLAKWFETFGARPSMKATVPA